MNPASAPSLELEAFGRLVALHYPAVVAVAFATTRHLALSEDIAQDTFVAAWTARGTLRDVGRVRPWLCGIARNQSKNALRRNRRLIAFDDHLEPADVAPSALEQTIDHQVAREVRAALARLPRAYREPLVLFYWQEQDIAQVASALSISEQAAQKRISRGRGYLKEGLAEKLEHVGGRRRSAGTAAAAVLGVLATRSMARAATASSGIAMHVVPVATRLLAVLALGVAAGLGTMAWLGHREHTTACDETTVPATPATAEVPETSTEVAQHLTSVDRKLTVMTFEDLDQKARERQLVERVAEIERSVHPAPRRHELPTPQQQQAPVAESAPVGDEIKSCDLVACTFEQWKGTRCCRKLEQLNRDDPETVDLSIGDKR